MPRTMSFWWLVSLVPGLFWRYTREEMGTPREGTISGDGGRYTREGVNWEGRYTRGWV